MQSADRHIVQGEQRVSDGSTDAWPPCPVMYSGSPARSRAKRRGHDRFMLPGDNEAGDRDRVDCFGVHAMEFLANPPLAKNDAGLWLVARPFGVSTMLGSSDIGA